MGGGGLALATATAEGTTMAMPRDPWHFTCFIYVRGGGIDGSIHPNRWPDQIEPPIAAVKVIKPNWRIRVGYQMKTFLFLVSILNQLLNPT